MDVARAVELARLQGGVHNNHAKFLCSCHYTEVTRMRIVPFDTQASDYVSDGNLLSALYPIFGARITACDRSQSLRDALEKVEFSAPLPLGDDL
jgi:hypothetical protein